VEGVAANGITLVNTYGADSIGDQHYIAAFNASLPESLAWTTVTGWFRGHGTPIQPAGYERAPSPLHPNVRYFRPLVYMPGAAHRDLDEIAIDIVEEGLVDHTGLGGNNQTSLGGMNLKTWDDDFSVAAGVLVKWDPFQIKSTGDVLTVPPGGPFRVAGNATAAGKRRYTAWWDRRAGQVGLELTTNEDGSENYTGVAATLSYDRFQIGTTLAAVDTSGGSGGATEPSTGSGGTTIAPPPAT
jgi:hypothetical protein